MWSFQRSGRKSRALRGCGGQPLRGRIALLLTLLLCSGCFKDRVEETLTIGVTADGAGTVHYAVGFDEVKLHGDRARERVERFQRSLVEGTADWPRSLRTIASRALVGSEQRHDEEQLVRYEAWSQTTDLERALPELFAHSAIDARVERLVDGIGIILVPGAPQGGDRRQRQRMERLLSDWTDAIAEYLEAVAGLWKHIETNPSRRMAILSMAFADLGEDEPAGTATTLEKALLSRYEEAELRVVGIYETPKGEAHTAQELSRLIYDPYSTDILLVLTDASGRALSQDPQSVEGLQAAGDGSWRVPRTSLWDAFRSLEGEWLQPDPLVAKAEFLLQATDGDAFDVSGFAQREFLTGRVPSKQEIREAVVDQLQPPEASRIVWATAAESEG